MKVRLCVLLLAACASAPASAPVPAPKETAGPAGCEPSDERNPACRGDPRACTEGHADCKCAAPPDVANPACWAVMPCPEPPDRRVRACAAESDRFVDRYVVGRVLPVAIMEPTGFAVTVGVGTDQGITKDWHVTLLRGYSDEPLEGGAITVRVVGRRETMLWIHRAPDLEANPRLRFERPH